MSNPTINVRKPSEDGQIGSATMDTRTEEGTLSPTVSFKVEGDGDTSGTAAMEDPEAALVKRRKSQFVASLAANPSVNNRLSEVSADKSNTLSTSPSVVRRGTVQLATMQAPNSGEGGTTVSDNLKKEIYKRKQSMATLAPQDILGLGMSAALAASAAQKAKQHEVKAVAPTETEVRVTMPDESVEVFKVPSDIQTVELCAQARERHSASTPSKTVDGNLFIILKAPTKPPRKLFDDELPLLALSKIYKMMNEEHPGLYSRDTIILALQAEKAEVMISIHLSKVNRALFSVPRDITALEMVEKARVKYNRQNDLPDDKVIPLAIEVSAPGKNDKRLDPNEILVEVTAEIKRKNAYINPERVRFSIVEKGDNVGLSMRLREMSQVFNGTEEDMALYQNLVAACVCCPELAIQKQIDESFQNEYSNRRSTIHAIGIRLNFADIDILKDLCMDKATALTHDMEESEMDDISYFDYENPEVPKRFLSRLLTTYNTNFLSKNAGKLVMLEETNRNDFVKIYEKTIWKVMDEERHEAEQAQHRHTMDEVDKENWRKLIEDLREHQMSHFNTWMDEFRALMVVMVLQIVEARKQWIDQDNHPYYYPECLTEESYQTWKGLENAEIDLIERHIKSNGLDYINMVARDELVHEAMVVPDIEPLAPFTAILHLTVLELENAKKCKSPYVQIRIRNTKLRTDTVEYDSAGKRATWSGDDALEFIADDAAAPMELQVYEETEGVESSFRKLLGKLSMPIHEVMRMNADALETDTRWFDLFPIGRVRMRVECLCEPMVTGLYKSGNTDVYFDESWHARYLVASQIGGQVSFDFFAPDSQTVKAVLTNNERTASPLAKTVSPLEVPQETALSAGETKAPLVKSKSKDGESAKSETSDDTVLKRGNLQVQKHNKEGKGTKIDKDVDYSEAELSGLGVVLKLTSRQLIVKYSNNQTVVCDLKDLQIVSSKRFWKDNFLNLQTKDDGKLKLKTDNKVVRDEWYDAILKAQNDLSANITARTGTIRRILNKAQNRDTEADEEAAANAEEEKQNMNRKKSMAALVGLSNSIAVGFGTEDLDANAAEREQLEARRTKHRRVLLRDFYVEKHKPTKGDILPTLKIFAENDCIVLRSPSEAICDEWLEILSTMAVATREYRLSLCTESQTQLALQQWQAKLANADDGTDTRRFLELHVEMLGVLLKRRQDHGKCPTHMIADAHAKLDYDVASSRVMNFLHEAFLSSTGMWLFIRFSSYFGIRETQRRFVVVEFLTQKMYDEAMSDALRTNLYHDLLVKMLTIIDAESQSHLHSDQIGEIYDKSGMTATTREKERFAETMARIESLNRSHLAKYKDWFPYAKGGLTQTLQMLKLVESVRWNTGVGLEDMSTVRAEPSIDARLNRRLRKLLTKGVEDRVGRHESVQFAENDENFIHTPGMTGELINFVFAELQEDQSFFSVVFDPYMEYIPFITKQYVYALRPGVVAILNNPDVPDYEQFEIYFKLKRIGDTYDKRSLASVLIMYLDLVDRWMKKVSAQTKDWTERAIKQDQFTPVQEDSLHSSSVLDMFCYLTDSYEFIENLEWPEPQTRMSLYGWYGKLLCNTIELYFDQMYSVCEKNFIGTAGQSAALNKRVWDQRFFTIVNDLEMVIEHHKKMYIGIRHDYETHLSVSMPKASHSELVHIAAEKLSFFGESFRNCSDVRGKILGRILRTMQSQVWKGVLCMFEIELREFGGLITSTTAVEMNTQLGKSGDLDTEVENLLAPTIKFLDARLSILGTHCHPSVFLSVLKTLWSMILKNITTACCPRNKKVAWSLSTQMSMRRFTIITHGIQVLMDFFFADGDGLPKEELRNEAMVEANDTMARCCASTRELITTFNNSATTKVEKNDIEWVLHTRTKDDLAVRVTRQLERKRAQEQEAIRRKASAEREAKRRLEQANRSRGTSDSSQYKVGSTGSKNSSENVSKEPAGTLATASVLAKRASGMDTHHNLASHRKEQQQRSTLATGIASGFAQFLQEFNEAIHSSSSDDEEAKPPPRQTPRQTPMNYYHR
ncbi:hypothetical protein SARC_00555 [Sphaeroforma arctica JP610]|uniref:PH domain-containing protein n=1 Tax=Sphaeroforma arctica JP610 TaxID=667725 RepID=A0A0L0GG87_9EUKA|nr:hypothetical protein SARC_00555 [Sphaeroforma arctica JP610]KNC87313.1 hypothetical protein SARC_00555 [Sphaeroforma arctica JP610]|eukprot:XP_014161215.1 hypothetical protein SARC_00555 [Sphaeroforma arctica JP610]